LFFLPPPCGGKRGGTAFLKTKIKKPHDDNVAFLRKEAHRPALPPRLDDLRVNYDVRPRFRTVGCDPAAPSPAGGRRGDRPPAGASRFFRTKSSMVAGAAWAIIPRPSIPRDARNPSTIILHALQSSMARPPPTPPRSARPVASPTAPASRSGPFSVWRTVPPLGPSVRPPIAAVILLALQASEFDEDPLPPARQANPVLPPIVAHAFVARLGPARRSGVHGGPAAPAASTRLFGTPWGLKRPGRHARIALQASGAVFCAFLRAGTAHPRAPCPSGFFCGSRTCSPCNPPGSGGGPQPLPHVALIGGLNRAPWAC